MPRLRTLILAFGQRFTAARYVSSAIRQVADGGNLDSRGDVRLYFRYAAESECFGAGRYDDMRCGGTQSRSGFAPEDSRNCVIGLPPARGRQKGNEASTLAALGLRRVDSLRAKLQSVLL